MRRIFRVAAVLPLLVGCHSDIVTTEHLRAMEYKCVYVEPVQSENPYVGRVLKDVFEKEFVRKRIALCEEENATVIITGSTFMTYRAATDGSGLTGRKSAAANQAIESVTVTAKDQAGNILLTASYDNIEQYTASKLAAEFGAALADKLR